MENNSDDTADLLERVRAGDSAALTELFARHRGRLRRMVEMRLDHRLQARLDASDVIQDAYLEVATRLEEYLRDPRMPVFLWMRLIVGDRLATLHRQHLGTQMRDAGREVSLYRGTLPDGQLGGSGGSAAGKADLTNPGRHACRADDSAPGGSQLARPH